jgi:hypothetical protein
MKYFVFRLSVLAALIGATHGAAVLTQLDAKCLTLQCRQAGASPYWSLNSGILLTEDCVVYLGFSCDAGIVSEIGHAFFLDIASKIYKEYV